MRYAGLLDDRLFQKLMGHIGRPDPRGFVLVLSAARREASPNLSCWHVDVRGVPAALCVETLYRSSSYMLIDQFCLRLGLAMICERCERELEQVKDVRWPCDCGWVNVVPSPPDNVSVERREKMAAVDLVKQLGEAKLAQEKEVMDLLTGDDPVDRANPNDVATLCGEDSRDEEGKTWRDRPLL